MDNISILSEEELQNELSVLANTKFTYAKPEEKKKTSTNLHSLLNVKLASLAEHNNYHTSMSPEAISRFYDNESPDCTPPNGYHSPNPTPPNGCYSPNPTPPNGIHLNQIIHGFQGVVNPPISFYNKHDTPQEEDEEDNFIKTMSILTSCQNKDTIEANKEIQSSKEETAPPGPLSKEDKRRRNTEASARFRIKKKLREQALQRTAEEMTEKAKMFENRVHELEREVKWLKALLVEKNDGRIEQMIMQQFNAPRIQHHSINSFLNH